MLFLKNAPHHDDDDHDDHGGLHRDLVETNAAMDRRGLFKAAARFGLTLSAMQLAGCVTDSATGASSNLCTAKIPEETQGPYPGDGSNGPNVLPLSGVVRSDLRSSFAGLNGTAAGVLLGLELTIVSASSCSPLEGYAVYLWHCDAAGNYSLYSSGFTNVNYLRGVQAADSTGKVRFTTIFPGCYAGRWPHMHFEVYRTLTAAKSVSNKIATSQIALPKASCDLVYAQSGYGNSAQNLSGVSLATDGIFSDGAQLELATVSGAVSTGMTATLTVAV